jgi:hypothetical protein
MEALAGLLMAIAGLLISQALYISFRIRQFTRAPDRKDGVAFGGWRGTFYR